MPWHITSKVNINVHRTDYLCECLCLFISPRVFITLSKGEFLDVCVCLKLADRVSILVSVPSLCLYRGAFVLHFAWLEGFLLWPVCSTLVSGVLTGKELDCRILSHALATCACERKELLLTADRLNNVQVQYVLTQTCASVYKSFHKLLIAATDMSKACTFFGNTSISIYARAH